MGSIGKISNNLIDVVFAAFSDDERDDEPALNVNARMVPLVTLGIVFGI